MEVKEVIAIILGIIVLLGISIIWAGGIDNASKYKPGEKTGWMDD